MAAASTLCARAWLVLLAWSAACEGSSASRATPSAPTSAKSPPEAPPASAPEALPDRGLAVMPGTELTHDAIAEELAVAEALSFSPVGTSSTVFRVKLDAPFDAAFKASTKERPQGPLAELFAYRIARCLGLEAVPPVVPRALPLEELRARYDASKGKQDAWSDIEPRLAVTPEGLVPGVLIYWIRELSDVGLDPTKGLARAREWLRIGGALPEAERSLAMSVSVLLGFDYIVGNFDRWSGSNTKGDPEKKRVYPRDHDMALPARLSEALHARIARQLVLAERTSASFYRRALALDRGCIEGLPIDVEDRDALLLGTLNAAQIEGVLDRRAGFVSHVQALIDEHSADAVLTFE
jgi:hypothetical protein